MLALDENYQTLHSTELDEAYLGKWKTKKGDMILFSVHLCCSLYNVFWGLAAQNCVANCSFRYKVFIIPLHVRYLRISF